MELLRAIMDIPNLDEGSKLLSTCRTGYILNITLWLETRISRRNGSVRETDVKSRSLANAGLS